MRIPAFRQLWLTFGLSSLGDWLGLLATGLFARNLFHGPAAQGAAFGGVIVVRLLPALILFPLAGVLADRFDRRLTMVVCDVLRFVLFASIPLAGLLLHSSAQAVTWALVATFLIETITMFWMPAKEAAVPNLVRGRVEAANQLSLITTYGLTPVLAALLLAGFSRAMVLLAGGDPSRLAIAPVDVALYFNALTFLAAAVVVWRIPGIGRPEPGRRQRPAGVLGSLVDGWRFVVRTAMVRGLVLGIVGAFAAGGVVVGVAPFYASSLGGGDATFAILFAVLFIGLGLGMALGPKLVRTLSRRRWFGLSIVLAGAAVTALALAPHLAVAVPLTALVGVGAGMAFLAGTTLLGTEVTDDVRGRTFAFVQAAVRVTLMVAIAAASVLGGIGASRRLGTSAVHVDVNASRILLLAAGLLAVFAGVVAFRRMDDRPGVPVLRDLVAALRGRPIGRPEDRYPDGLFVVFEGGEGAGKSTQAVKLAAWLRVEGRECVLTREPGATELGARIRGILLDRSSAGLAPRAEALLYAADRAHHVASVIRPALARGEVVISDRYVDSSLAYQGAGRALPAEEIGWLSEWATGGLVPDLVVLLDVDPAVGLGRVSERGEADRLETEQVEFHERVRQEYLDLAAADPRRYLVVPAAADADEIADRVRERVGQLLTARDPSFRPDVPTTVRVAYGAMHGPVAAADTARSAGRPDGTGAATASRAAVPAGEPADAQEHDAQEHPAVGVEGAQSSTAGSGSEPARAGEAKGDVVGGLGVTPPGVPAERPRTEQPAVETTATGATEIAGAPNEAAATGQTEAVTAQVEAVAAPSVAPAATGQAEAVTGQTEAVTGQTEAVTGQTEAVTGQTEAVTGQTEAVTGQTEAVTAQTEAVAAPSVAPVPAPAAADGTGVPADAHQPAPDENPTEEHRAVAAGPRPADAATLVMPAIDPDNPPADVTLALPVVDAPTEVIPVTALPPEDPDDREDPRMTGTGS